MTTQEQKAKIEELRELLANPYGDNWKEDVADAFSDEAPWLLDAAEKGMEAEAEEAEIREFIDSDAPCEPLPDEEIERMVATITSPYGQKILDDRGALLLENRKLRAELDAIGASLAAEGKDLEHLIACGRIGKETTVIGKSRLEQLAAEERDSARHNLVERQKFKDWVHNYLDTHGVPHHPPGTHGEHGCRIGDRMDWLMEQLAAKERECGELKLKVAPYVEAVVLDLENEVDWEMCHTEAQKSISRQLQEAKEFLAALNIAPAAEGGGK